MSYLATPQYGPADLIHQQKSFLEHFEPDRSTVALTHFVEWFSGDDIDSIWTKNNVAGTNTFQMADAVDGGFEIITDSASSSDRGSINFNDIRHYSTNIIMVAVMKIITAANRGAEVGVSDNDRLNSNSMSFNDATANSFTLFKTIKATTSSTVNTSLTPNENEHVYREELTSTAAIGHIDGILEATKTNDLPTVVMQPLFFVRNFASNKATVRIRYYEAYNT